MELEGSTTHGKDTFFHQEIPALYYKVLLKFFLILSAIQQGDVFKKHRKSQLPELVLWSFGS